MDRLQQLLTIIHASKRWRDAAHCEALLHEHSHDFNAHNTISEISKMLYRKGLLFVTSLYDFIA